MKFTRWAVIIGIFTALSVVGGLVKLTPLGSIALDSAPGYFVAAFYSPALGAFVALFGHIGSAATGGMPLGGLHALIAPAMFLISGLFGIIARRGPSISYLIVAGVVAVILNGVILPLALIPFGLPRSAAISLIPLLVTVSAVNILLASVAAWTSAKLRPGA
ncbi:MAG: ECF transporter S component [Sphingomonas sp.]